jgi:hypothetical protein
MELPHNPDPGIVRDPQEIMKRLSELEEKI